MKVENRRINEIKDKEVEEENEFWKNFKKWINLSTLTVTLY